MRNREDEVKKHCPRLVCKTFHNSRRKNEDNITLSGMDDIHDLSRVDVIISTSTFEWPADGESVVSSQDSALNSKPHVLSNIFQ